jgi:ABC-2 type transport system permease protein
VTTTSLQKYWLIFKLHWQNLLTYPISFLFWRLRQILSTVTSLTFWSVVFMGTSSAFGYTREAMISYIFLTAFLQSVVLATFLNGLSEDIYTGTISNTLVKPIKLFGIWITQELADKSNNVAFVIGESILLMALFRPQIYFPPLDQFFVFLAATLLGAVVLFYIMLLFGTIGFWSQESWGIRFLFYMVVDFTAGKLYPLDILPPMVKNALFLTPFPYLSYVQTQLFLGKYPPEQTGQIFFVIITWIILLAAAFHIIWNHGLKAYGAVGR